MCSNNKTQTELKLVVDNQPVSRKPNYETLYHAAFSRLTDLYQMVITAQQDLENMYLQQTDPVKRPEFIQSVEVGEGIIH